MIIGFHLGLQSSAGPIFLATQWDLTIIDRNAEVHLLFETLSHCSIRILPGYLRETKHKKVVLPYIFFKVTRPISSPMFHLDSAILERRYLIFVV